jgi:hypothetical protein
MTNTLSDKQFILEMLRDGMTLEAAQAALTYQKEHAQHVNRGIAYDTECTICNLEDSLDDDLQMIYVRETFSDDEIHVD